MGLTKAQREKRDKLVVMAKRGEGNEADIAQAKVEEFDARIAAEAPRHREWGDGGGRKVKSEPVLTDDDTSSALATIGPLQQALAAATAAGDLKGLKDVASMASALRVGARARGMGIVSENQAAEVVIRAERAIGRVLETMAAEGRLAQPGDWKERERDGRSGKPAENQTAGLVLTWAELGMDYKTAGRYRLIASLDENEFDALLTSKRESNERIAKVDFYRAAMPVEPHQTPIARQARADIAEALSSESAITQVAEWLAATDALLTLTDAVPTDELRSIGLKATELVAWYNLQKQQRSTL